MPSRWCLRPAESALVQRFAREQRVSELVARMLVARGHREPAAGVAHLEARLTSLRDPGELPGVAAAAERLQRAVRDGETILIHGDYDVDGLCGTALLARLFSLLGARAIPYVPNRLVDGYSFGPHSVARAVECGATLVVSVDNGTSAGATIGELLERGIETIVTDHHEPPRGALPPAVAIVNPKLAGSTYPFRELCGAAVAFKLAWGACQVVSSAPRVREDLKLFLTDAMAYVAIATLCDVVPLVDENRVLARRGLSALEVTRQAGLRALLDACELGRQALNGEDVGFKLGPRLNAAGRLGSAETALELLLCDDAVRARALASELESKNSERKRVEAALLAQALAAASAFEDPRAHPVLVLAGEGWHTGVVGIVAARLAERFQRPAIVIGLENGVGRGSARSVSGFDVLDAMRGGERHMLRFGGHAQAAGLEVRAESVDALRAAICERARELLAGSERAERELWVDYDLPLAHMTPELMRELDRLEPFGEKNEKPVLVSRDVRLAEPPRMLGQGGAHLSMSVRSGERVLRAIGFGLGARAGELQLGVPLHVAYTPRWNAFRGERNLELALADFRVGPRPDLVELN